MKCPMSFNDPHITMHCIKHECAAYREGRGKDVTNSGGGNELWWRCSMMPSGQWQEVNRQENKACSLAHKCDAFDPVG